MNQQQSAFIMQGMIEFIRTQGEERVNQINQQMETDFTVQSEKMIQSEKKRLQDQMMKDLQIAERDLKIEKSKKANKERINRMKRTNELVESLQAEAGVAMAQRLTNNRDDYANLLKNLLVQGLIKLIEAKVTLRCRQSDVDVLSSIVDEAVQEYKTSMLEQVAALEGKDDIPCVVTVDDAHFLPEFNAQDPTNSCLGGFVMYARKNRIVCSQTLDDRLAMTFQQSIPAMRASLFPSLTKQRNK